MSTVKYSDHLIVSDFIYERLDKSHLRLIYSGRSGKVVPISLTDYELVKSRVVPEVDSEIFKILWNSEMLVDSAHTDTEAIVARNNAAINNPSSLSFVILPTSFCNMGCSYCGQSHTKGGISKNITSKIVERVTQALQQVKPKNISVGWFGGEPLVGYSKIIELSDIFIFAANQIGASYDATMATNGSLLTLDKLLELHMRCNINEICITFDGPPGIHDSRRILKNGKSNFCETTKLVQEALKEPRLKKLRYIFRTNIDKGNQEYIDEYLDIMYQLGFADNRIGYDLKGVYSWSNDVSSVEINKVKYAEMESRWLRKMLEYDMKCNYLFKANKVTCVAVSPYSEVISSSGKTFSCTEHPLVPVHELSDFISDVNKPWDGKRALGQFDGFNDLILSKGVPCSSCKLLGVCGGGCPKHWAEGHIPCPSLKYNLQQRLNIVAVKMGYRVLKTGDPSHHQ